MIKTLFAGVMLRITVHLLWMMTCSVLELVVML